MIYGDLVASFTHVSSDHLKTDVLDCPPAPPRHSADEWNLPRSACC